MGTAISFILIFFIIVVSHELGHFILAKMNGIHVVEFSIGMGPTIVHFTRGDTKYSLKLLPIGGACMFEGEDALENEKGTPSEKSFQNASVWARISSVLAGPLFNFIIAYIIGMILVANSVTDLPVIKEVSEGSPAAEAGLLSGDMITKINRESIHIHRQVSVISAMNKGETLNITYERDGEQIKTSLTPAYNEEEGRYYMGITGPGELLECTPLQTFEYAFYEVEFGLRTTVKSLLMLVRGQLGRNDVAGPVGLVKVVGETYDATIEYGISTVILNMLNIAMLLSVNLGVINLLPLPALDGGRLVFFFIEIIRGKPVPAEKEGMIHLAGFIALMILMVVVLFNDISKFFV